MSSLPSRNTAHKRKMLERLKHSLPYKFFIISYASPAVLPIFDVGSVQPPFSGERQNITFNVRTHDAAMLPL
jgi:hypothetical protein